MKAEKLIAIILVLVLSLSLLTACREKDGGAATSDSVSNTENISDDVKDSKSDQEVYLSDMEDAADPTDTKTKDKPVLQEEYVEIVEDIVQTVSKDKDSGKKDNNKKDDDVDKSDMYENNDEPSQVGYALVDLDNNGQQELIVSAFDLPYFYDLYTIVDGEAVHLIGSNNGYNCFIYEDGYVEVQWKDGTSANGHDFYLLSNGELALLERVAFDAQYAIELSRIDKLTDSNRSNCFFKSSSTAKSDYVSIIEPEALDMISSYQSSMTALVLEYTPVSEYIN